jgi:ribosomal protein L3 glutamine methyltransferase
LPYLTNIAWFAGMKFYVDERVIVPKSPIGELIRNDFEPWVDKKSINSVLDLCTGSGCIGIGMARVFSDAKITISDISEDALEVAKRNVKDHNLNNRVAIIESDLFKNIDGAHFDLIVSNPPYVDHQDIIEMPEEYKKEPILALEAGNDGLDIVKRILRQAPHHLNDGGILIVEVGNSQYALQDQYPSVPFTWLSFADGGDGVFMLTLEELLKYHEQFLKG